MLRQVPGFENFDPKTEVLHCDKPGTGLVDAPRAFSMKLSQITRDKCKLIPSQVDPELCFRHDNGRLVCVLTKHVDDIKIAGEPTVVKTVLRHLEECFGELKIVWNDFVNRGVRHFQDTKTKEVWLDEIEYAKALKPIEHAQIKTAKPEDLAVEELHRLFMSLLGAVAYLSHTRPDIVVFVSALERQNAKPQVIHV